MSNYYGAGTISGSVVEYTISNNLCFRCGKQRIVSRTYTDANNGSPLTYTENVCPDPKCQSLLNNQLASEKAKRDQIAEAKVLQERQRAEDKKNELLSQSR